VNTEHTSHLCSLVVVVVVVVCGHDRPSADPTVVDANSADSKFEDPHTTDTPIDHVCLIKRNVKYCRLMLKENEHRALSNADTKYDALTQI